MVRDENSPAISRGALHDRGTFDIVLENTALKRMIDTASFTIPSPNTIEKSIGCSSNFIILTAATVSEQHITDEKSSISTKVSLKGEDTPVSGLYFSNAKISKSKKFSPENARKATKVPTTPKRVM